MKATKTYLLLEFANTLKLAEFVEDLREHDVLPRDSAVYLTDALDDIRSGQGCYLLRRKGARPEQWRLRVREVPKPGPERKV